MHIGPREPVRLPWWGLVAILAAYATAIGLMQRVSKVSYNALANTTSNLGALAGIVAVGASILVVVTTALGWWPQVMRDHRPIRGWPAALPLLMLVASLSILNVGALPRLGAAYVLAAAGTMLLVGFSEELLTRGILLTGFRGLAPERWAWFWSTLAFGGMHMLNVLSGRTVLLSLAQACLAFLTGTVLYLARRASGSLVVPMLLHAFWDFALFTQLGATAQSLPMNVGGFLLGAVLTPAMFLATLFAIRAIWTGKVDAEAQPAIDDTPSHLAGP
jgi:membrane protease YdiL (CAAX protease family)